ncbi:MAG: mannosyltransferase [Bacteroidales bacterium]|nr:mannosyltransferase [Bacteroidales bacterium]
MIPKIIHYCWFSGDNKPKTIQTCIDSWARVMPNYTIKCWDDNSFDFDSVPFVREAMAAKKYAFAADYVRLYALMTEGGIYLDSDVLVKRPFDTFLSNDFFCGTEAYYIDNELHYRMEAAIMGSTKDHPFIKKCLSFYHNKEFSVEKAGKEYVMPKVISEYAQYYGYIYENIPQKLDRMTIYPTSVFTNTLHQDTSNVNELYAIHQNAGSWIDHSDRGWLFRICKKYDYMSFYHWLEQLRK